jgi:parallel beta-helix repeat protein
MFILVILYFQLFSFLEIENIPSANNYKSPGNEIIKNRIFEISNHTSFYIQGDYELELIASEENWLGNGSESNPYIITGYKVNGSDPNSMNTSIYLLFMNQTKLHCRIRNNILINANESIIHLVNVTNVEIEGNFISNSCSNGLVVKNSENISISNNSIYLNKGNGTFVLESSNVTITNNSIFNNNGNGIAPVTSEDIVISYNNIYFNNISGISVEESIEVSIFANSIFDTNNYEGIVLHSSDNNSIKRNAVYNNSRIGIALFGSDENEIEHNIVFNNNRFGILIEYSNRNTISSNIVYRTVYLDGIQIYFADDNYVFNNKVYGNTRDGVLLYFSTKNLIENNTIYSNKGQAVAFHGSFVNDLFSNIFYKNNGGVTLWGGCDLNRVNYNVFCNSISDEISVHSDNNLFSQNDIHSNFNMTKISDEGSSNTFTSNYFSNWISPDSDTNGIVDLSFSISGSAGNQDSSPRVSPQYHALMPAILISPRGTESFSSEITIQWEPSFDAFNHSINYELFYSNDGGITWNSVIDQYASNTYIWNISSLMNGNDYMIKVVAICSEELKFVTISDKSFTILNHELSPFVLITPKDGERLIGFCNISWSSVNDSLGHQVNYTVHFSSDGGLNWMLLTLKQYDTSFEWDTTSVEDGTHYKIMIVAECCEGQSLSFVQSGKFIIQNSPRFPPEFILLIIIIFGLGIFGITGWGFHNYNKNKALSSLLTSEDFRLGICLGYFSKDSWKIIGKNENCPFENTRLLPMIEFSAVSYKHGEFEQIYGPFPQIMTPDTEEGQWQFISFSFIMKDNSSSILDQELDIESNQVILLIYYEKQFEFLINSTRKLVQKHLISLTTNSTFAKTSLNEIESGITDLIRGQEFIKS